MDMLILPHADPDTKLTEAMDLMEQQESRGILVPAASGGWWLFTTDDIFDAWKADHEGRCGDLIPSPDRHVTELRPLHSPAPPFHLTFDGFIQKVLDAVGAPFAAIVPENQPATHAFVVTQHEGGKDLILSSSKLCRCTKNSAHRAKCPPDPDGGPCDYCDGNWRCR